MRIFWSLVVLVIPGCSTVTDREPRFLVYGAERDTIESRIGPPVRFEVLAPSVNLQEIRNIPLPSGSVRITTLVQPDIEKDASTGRVSVSYSRFTVVASATYIFDGTMSTTHGEPGSTPGKYAITVWYDSSDRALAYAWAELPQ